MLKPIGILGGMFDPVHHGHLRLALEAHRQLDLQEVRLIPLHTPPHRAAPKAATRHRLAMLRLAIHDSYGLSVDERELTRRGTSYSIDTVHSLRQDHPRQPLCLIIGMDEFRLLDTWRDWTSLLDIVHLIIVDRPGLQPLTDRPPLAELLSNRQAHNPDALHSAAAGVIVKINAPLLEISSTYIRELIRAGNSIKYLTPDPVINYINQENLYQ